METKIYRVVVKDGVFVVTTGGKLPLRHAINQAILKARESGQKEISLGKATIERSGLDRIGFDARTQALGLGGAQALAQRL